MNECKWTEDFEGNWETSCDNMFTLNAGTPSDNGMKYCCYCGKPLREVRYVEEAVEGDNDDNSDTT